MPRTTILTCHGCRKPVGHTNRNDAVVHVDYGAIHRAENDRRDWKNKTRTQPCAACSKPSITISGIPGRFHLDGSDNLPCAVALEPSFRDPAYRCRWGRGRMDRDPRDRSEGRCRPTARRGLGR